MGQRNFKRRRVGNRNDIYFERDKKADKEKKEDIDIENK